MKQDDIEKLLEKIKAPHGANNAVDVLADEYEIAATINRYAKKRYDKAVDAIIAHDPSQVGDTRLRATNSKSRQEHTWRGSKRLIVCICNSPASRVDAAAFYNELLKAGVDRAKLDDAKAKATKTSSPATSFQTVNIDE